MSLAENSRVGWFTYNTMCWERSRAPCMELWGAPSRAKGGDEANRGCKQYANRKCYWMLNATQRDARGVRDSVESRDLLIAQETMTRIVVSEVPFHKCLIWCVNGVPAALSLCSLDTWCSVVLRELGIMSSKSRVEFSLVCMVLRSFTTRRNIQFKSVI